jgi:hypothetical protein
MNGDEIMFTLKHDRRRWTNFGDYKIIIGDIMVTTKGEYNNFKYKIKDTDIECSPVY